MSVEKKKLPIGIEMFKKIRTAGFKVCRLIG